MKCSSDVVVVIAKYLLFCLSYKNSCVSLPSSLPCFSLLGLKDQCPAQSSLTSLSPNLLSDGFYGRHLQSPAAVYVLKMCCFSASEQILVFSGVFFPCICKNLLMTRQNSSRARFRAATQKHLNICMFKFRTLPLFSLCHPFTRECREWAKWNILSHSLLVAAPAAGL